MKQVLPLTQLQAAATSMTNQREAENCAKIDRSSSFYGPMQGGLHVNYAVSMQTVGQWGVFAC